MGRWLDRYLDGDCLETWVNLYGYGKQCREDPEFEEWDDVVAVVRETMRRARRNVERLVELLPPAGWQFRDPKNVHVPPLEGIETVGGTVLDVKDFGGDYEGEEAEEPRPLPRRMSASPCWPTSRRWRRSEAIWPGPGRRSPQRATPKGRCFSTEEGSVSGRAIYAR